MAQGVTALGQGAAGTHNAVVTYEAATREADALHLKADLKRLQLLQDDEIEHLTRVLQSLDDMYSRVAAVLQGHASITNDVVRHTAA